MQVAITSFGIQIANPVPVLDLEGITFTIARSRQPGELLEKLASSMLTQGNLRSLASNLKQAKGFWTAVLRLLAVTAARAVFVSLVCSVGEEIATEAAATAVRAHAPADTLISV